MRIGPREWLNNCTEKCTRCENSNLHCVPVGDDCRVFSYPVNARHRLSSWTILAHVGSLGVAITELSFSNAVDLSDRHGCELSLLFSSNYGETKTLLMKKKTGNCHPKTAQPAHTFLCSCAYNCNSKDTQQP